MLRLKAGQTKRKEPSPAEVLDGVDDAIARLVTADKSIGHEMAGRLMDHVAEALERIRRRHGIASVWQEAAE
jgi:hypothetical protein